MRESAVLHRVKEGYTTGARSLASRSIVGLARTRVTPNALTTAGVSLCLAAAVLVYFEYLDDLLFYWLGAVVFVVGSILDILDGALARAGGEAKPFGSFLDSTTDRVGEGAMLGAIALVFSRHGNEVALAAAIAAVAGSFLVSYTRAKAEALGLRGARRRDHRGPRARAVGRAAVGDLPADRNGLDHRRAADPVRAPAARGAGLGFGPVHSRPDHLGLHHRRPRQAGASRPRSDAVVCNAWAR